MPNQPPTINESVSKLKLFVWLFFGILILTTTVSHAEQAWTIYEANGRLSDGKDVWQIPLSRCAKLPEWKPQEGEPPLSPGKATAIASRWIHGGEMESIEIRPVNRSDSGRYRSVYFYAITFSVAPYGNHKSCVVLMDGTVLEPQPPPRKPAMKK
jgi:hypothetical protein